MYEAAGWNPLLCVAVAGGGRDAGDGGGNTAVEEVGAVAVATDLCLAPLHIVYRIP